VSTGSAPGLAIRNHGVQRVRRLASQRRARRDEGAFVVEGETLVSAALAAGVAPVEAVYAAAGWDGALLDVARAAGVPVHTLAPGVMERVATTVTPQPVIAVVGHLGDGMEALRAAVGTAGPVLVCVDVRDPGNLGTVMRSGLAAGVSGIIFCDGCADAYNPKCVRASAGALFHLPMVTGGPILGVLAELGSWGLQRLGTRASGGTPYDDADLARPTALVLGNEAHGLAPAVEGALDGLVSIPMAPSSESLNVGAAAAVLAFEAARQRRARARPA